MTEYAIQIPWEDSWMWVTRLVEGMDYAAPVVKNFATREEAEKAADFWRMPGKESLVKVVEYDSNA